MGYVATWVTKRKLTLFGWKIRSELKTLTPAQLGETLEVLQILTGMVGDEIDERSPGTPIQRRSKAL